MKKLSRIFTLLMALAVVLSLTTTAYAATSVTYDGKANEFIFAPENLFESFQNVMPGDSLTEQIVIKNDTSNNYKVKFYMRSLGAQEGTDEFLSQMNLTVNQVGKSELFEAPADETAQLAGWVYLGTLKSGGNITLDVTLDVPITMGNDYQKKIGYVDWQFKIEEIPIDTSLPGTGDTTNVMLSAGLMIVSLFALIALLYVGKRRRKDET